MKKGEKISMEDWEDQKWIDTDLRAERDVFVLARGNERAFWDIITRTVKDVFQI